MDIINQFTNAQKAAGSFFISIEGIEGSGKSSQMELICEYLKERNKEVTLTREPGGTEFGEKLRNAILKSEVDIAPAAEAHLFASARAQHLHELILPKLQSENSVVIADRFIDSSLAYQGIARGLGIENVLKLHQEAPLTVLPDITFYFAIDYETSIARQKLRGDKLDYFEKNNKEFYLGLIEGYEQAAKLFPKRVKRIDATKSIKEVGEQVCEILEKEIC